MRFTKKNSYLFSFYFFQIIKTYNLARTCPIFNEYLIKRKNDMQKKNRYKDETLREIIESIKIFIDYLLKTFDVEIITEMIFDHQEIVKDLQDFFVLLAEDTIKNTEEKLKISIELNNFFEWCLENLVDESENSLRVSHLHQMKEECKNMKLEFESVRIEFPILNIYKFIKENSIIFNFFFFFNL